MLPQVPVFRRATIEDLDILRHWDNEPHIIESDPNDDWNWETELLEDPPWREQWMACLGDHPIGYMQIIDPQLETEHYWGNVGPGHRAIDIWIGERQQLNKGHGTRMMRFAIDRCFADPTVHTILIDPLESNTRARRFYERLGFQALGPRRFGDDDCMVYTLERAKWVRVSDQA